MLPEETLLLVHGGGVDLWAVGWSGLGEVVAAGVEVAEVVGELELRSETVLFREGSEVFQRHPFVAGDFVVADLDLF